MRVTIESLAVQGFKGAKGSQAWEFGPKVEIAGDNYTGKTSIAEAIVYGLAGVNLEGSNRTDNLICLGQKAAKVIVRFTGIDGLPHEVIRSRGAKGSQLLLDGLEASQAQLERVLGPTEAFLAAFWPASLGALKDAEARDFFLRLVRPPAWEEVAGQLLPEEQDLLAPYRGRQDVDELMRELRQALRELEDEAKRAAGARQAYEEALRQEKEAPEAVDTSGLEKELAEAQEEMARLNVPPAPIPIEGLDRQLQACKARYEALKLQIPQWKVVPGTLCPTCRQLISQEHVERVKAEIERSTAKLRREMQAVVEEARRIRAELDRALAENKRREDEWFTAGDARRKELAARIAELKAKLTEATQANARRAAILQQAEQARAKLAELAQAEEENRKAAARLKAELAALTQFAAKRAELMAQELQRGLKRASIQLFDVAKTTGEIKPVFRLLYDGKPYAVLSTSERVRLGLEIAGLIKRLVGIEYPTFIDNAESITHFDPPPGQLFVARVVPGQKLTVTSEGGEEHGDQKLAAAGA